jgi:hypothetical protein
MARTPPYSGGGVGKFASVKISCESLIKRTSPFRLAGISLIYEGFSKHDRSPLK